MSLSNKQPASLSEYSQLCKAKNTDSFSESYRCMETQKGFGKTEFEWQRTEGKLNEIGLNVNSGGQIKDGLVKNAGFTDEDKLCFFEGKLDKELKIAQKDKREIEVQGKTYPAAPGHLESWSLISDPFPSAEGNLGNPKTTDSHLGKEGAEKPGAGLGKNEAITDQEKAAGKSGMETKCQPERSLPNLSVSESEPGKSPKEREISVWNPNFNPVLPNHSGSKEASVKKDGAPSYCVIGVVNDNYVQSEFPSSPTAPKPEPPTTTIELAQDDSKSAYFNSIGEMEEEVEEKLSSTEGGIFMTRATHQRKAMRRAMSECSHLSVPLTLNLADKYPEPLVREDLATGLLSPSSSLTQSPSPAPRKPSAPMKRSMTVSEEQTSGSQGAEQNNAELPSLVVREHPSLATQEPAAKKREERNSSSSGGLGKKELGSPGLYLSKLEQIPEIGGHDKGREEEEATKRDKRNLPDEAARLNSPRSGGSEMEPSKAAVLERKEIEVSDVQRTPSSQRGDLPRDAKPEEIKPVETVTGSDITAPPNKELPPSPEKKTKPSASTPSAKPAAEKAKPLSATSPKRPASTTPGQNKKSTSPTTGPAAATPKRPATGTPRPSTLTAKETKPKVAEAKSTEKRTSLSKSASATTPRTSVKSSPAAPRTTAASPVTTTSSMKNTSASPPKRPTSIKTETKPADAKKTPVKSPSADLSRPRSAPGNSLKSSTTTSTATTPTTTMTSPGVATSRPKPKPAATRPTTASSANADAKKPLAAKAPLKTSTTSKPSRPTSSVSAPDLKNVRSKIGSTDNIKHQPGGGKGKVEKKPESAGAARKPESNAVSKMATTKTTVTKESAQKQPNGKVQIQTKKVDLSKVSSKCGSKTNIKHKPGGGDIKTENQKLNFKEKPQGKVGSVDSAGQTPTEGPVKTEESKEAVLPAVAPLDGAAAVPQAGGITQENGVGPAVPAAAGGGDQRDSQSFDTQIQETN
ncbi:microtubule-associated protein 4 isoform B [Alligator mississippiensis]|uniref:Microtubule-associated protein n=1 Tax=Alligator mississippiensis TaxID=8496 RepID=A0A151N947_ALLMI|nr:microtubule-associated protein 4 isoform B [Alligator mississippiensis]